MAGLVLASIATRPASIWTSSRPITTERGDVAPVAGLPGEITGTAPVTPQRTADYASTADAAAWLSAKSGADDIVATTNPTSALVPALTGRAMFLAGDLYQVGLGRADELPMIDQRRGISVALRTGLTAPDVAVLCASDVRWVWFEGSPGAAAALGLPTAYANDEVTVLRLPDEACPAY